MTARAAPAPLNVNMVVSDAPVTLALLLACVSYSSLKRQFRPTVMRWSW
jgi:hypothetical protein